MDTSPPKDFAGSEWVADTGALAREGMLRQERLVELRDGVRIKIDGRWMLNFCSNDYLGLSQHPVIIRSMQEAAGKYGVGSSASPLVCGKSILHKQLEQRLATLTGRDRALILSSGYAANLAIQSALIRSRHQLIVQDRLCHASMVDAAAITRARIRRYRHLDVQSLDSILNEKKGQTALVLTESVFSMDGDIAPLPEIAKTCRNHGACLVVDDAHGFGVIGAQGLGGMDHYALDQKDVPLMMATFGKAAGGYGAFVAGPDALIETMIQRARPYIYSTALPVPLIAAANTALDVMSEESWRQTRLRELISHFRAGANRRGIRLMDSHTAIQPVITGTAEATLACSRALEARGLFVSAIRPPTVPPNSSRLRITLTASHTKEEIDELLSALELILMNVMGIK